MQNQTQQHPVKSTSGPFAARPNGPAAPPKKAKAKQVVETFDFNVGDRLGDDMVVTEQLSAGPTTELYKVYSERQLASFACKVLRAHVPEDSPEARALRLECTVLKRLSHPNVVRVYDCHASLALEHVVMEYLPGPTLFERLAASPRRRLPVAEALRIGAAIGGALAHLHEAGYLFRDLKPANVIDRNGVPVLIDFGAVYKYVPGRRARVRVGTDPYMAPEQCLQRALSPRTDVFGLGALVYEMLTGEWPFEDQLMNVFDRKRLENRFPQVVHTPGSIRRRASQVPPEVEEVVQRCLARRPKERYRTAADAARALAELASALSSRGDRAA